ncbi:FAD-dependent oxidoreductase [Selenomonas artemidis]|nr:FAD-dependent oxidoreductase [Selenomonas artemidis]
MANEINVQNLIIGFGKAGKTLAGFLAKRGEKTALVERSKQRYGGTCINVACIPSKSLEYSARLSAAEGGSFEEKARRYAAAIAEKRRLTAMLRQKNYDKVASTGADILDGEARFIDAHTVCVTADDGTETQVHAGRIFINTGALPITPAIPGAAESTRCHTSETMMELDTLPRRLVIIGGGYIGLEFASYYANFGSEVTVVQHGADFIPREDAEVAARVKASLKARSITVLTDAAPQRIEDNAAETTVVVQTSVGEQSISADAVLLATGRKPNTEGLELAAAGIDVTPRGAVAVDAHLQTNVPHIWAMGDVTGGLQFTYISLDDFRIVRDQLAGAGARTTENRGAVPYTVFLDPPLSRVGMTEDEARAAGYDVRVLKLEAAAVPKAQVLRNPVGLLKAIVDTKTDKVLGAHFFCPGSEEMINLMKLAIDAGITAHTLGQSIYNHPTMSEALNDLFV